MERPFCFNRNVAIPFEQAVTLLREQPELVLGAAEDSMTTLADGQPRELHVIAPTPTTPHDIDIVIGPPQTVDAHAVMLPIRWESVSGARWVPTVDGEIEIIDESHTTPWIEVSFFGRYEPRLGALGGAMDALVMHTIVESTLKQFLDNVCEHIREGAQVGEPTG